jgi:outer membrane receptor for ferrienterochelin and colicin
MFNFRAGIDNLFDRSPNIIGALPGTTAAVGEPDPAGTYDVLGRRFYLGVKVDF